MSNSIKIDGLADEINGLIVNYGISASAAASALAFSSAVRKECVTKVAGSTLKKIKKNSPVKTGKYKKGWRKTVVKENSTSLVITVHDAKYSLVHLLEKGHQKRGGGRVPAIKHVEPAEQAAIAELEKEIMSKL